MVTGRANDMTAPDKLSIIVFSGDYDRIHYALAMASSAVAIDRAVTLFFTMDGIRALMRADAEGAPDWSGREADYAAKKIGTVGEMLSACIELGAIFMVCEMGLRATGIDERDLRDDITIATGGIVAFLNDASRHGQMIMI
jgi:peroxiredoxin family protein